MKSDSPQLINIVLLRSFAIIAVVLYHCFCPWLYAWNWSDCHIRPIYSFCLECVLVGRMPLFIAVSGYLFSYLLNERAKYQTFTILVANKIKRLLLPCILFSFIMSITFNSNLIFDLFYTPYHLWFLKMLFLCFMTTWILGKYVKGKYQVGSLTIALSLMALPGIDFFSIGQFFKYYIFFYIGYLFCLYRKCLYKYMETKTALMIHLLVYGIMCLIIAYFYYVNKHIAYEDIIHLAKPIAILRNIMRFYSIIIGFSLANYFINKHPNYNGGIFKKLNNLSYGIYLLHIYFLNILHDYYFDVFSKINTSIGLAFPFFLFVIIFCSSAFLTWLFKLTKAGKYIL